LALRGLEQEITELGVGVRPRERLGARDPRLGSRHLDGRSRRVGIVAELRQGDLEAHDPFGGIEARIGGARLGGASLGAARSEQRGEREARRCGA
jgi:hypothetical protein